MKTNLWAIAVLWLSVSPVVADEAEDLAAIKRLVPAASAMALAEFDKLATAATAPKPGDLDNKSLTLMLISAQYLPDDEKANAEFGMLGDRVPKPSALATEMARNVRGAGRFRFATGPVTMIHADRITDIQGKVEGDKATGVITYTVPMLYQGQVQFIANRKDGKWQIVEFQMPARKVHIVRNEKGTWDAK